MNNLVLAPDAVFSSQLVKWKQHRMVGLFLCIYRLLAVDYVSNIVSNVWFSADLELSC
jgi:hypothetical protein